jgi:exodeoxyribonuclease-3
VTLRLLTYNIRRGGRRREKPLGEVICACRPDVVILQEAILPRVVEQIARDSGMTAWGSEEGRSLAFLSRVPLADRSWHRPRRSRHAFLELRLKDSSARIFGVHLSAVHAAWTERRRVRELRALLDRIDAEQHGFHVLAGDFNTLAPGELLDPRKLPHRLRALVWLSGGRIQWKTISTILQADYCDGYRMLHADVAGLTFPTWNPHVRLDYVFLPTAHASRLRACEVITNGAAGEASDHFPLLAEIEI